MGAGQVVVFDTGTRQVLTVIDGLPGVTGVWVVPELDRLYASATGVHQVAIIDTRSSRVIARVGRIGFPDGIAYASVARKIFVSDEAGGGELVIDAARDRATGTIPLGGEAGNSIYDPSSGCVLVALQTRNEIVAIDPASEHVVGRYAFAQAVHPHGLSLDAVRRLLFVANEGDATLLAVDLRTMRVIQRQPVGRSPDVLAFDPGSRRLYVAAESGTVTVLEERGDTLARVASLAMPGAHSVSVSPSTHSVFFPLQGVGGQAVLRIIASTSPTGRVD
jgi:DNA-binding beta-propeller fold protein YncE